MKKLRDLFIEKDNYWLLENKEYLNEKFDEFSIYLSSCTDVRIHDTKFIDCRVGPGACAISKNFRLENVWFSEFECGKAMHIDSEAFLDRVTIEGKSPSKIWVMRNDRESLKKLDYSKVEYALNISNFLGEVSIAGIPSDKIIKNESLHIIVKASWREDIKWGEIGISQTSMWKSYVRSVLSSGFDECIFSLPNSRSKYYKQTMDEMELIKSSGIIM